MRERHFATTTIDHDDDMLRFKLPGFRLSHTLRQTTTTKIFIFLFLLFCSFIIWQYPQDVTIYDGNLTNEALRDIAYDFRYSEVYRKKRFLPKNLKYVLLWTEPDFAPFYYLGKGQRAFIKNKCSKVNCYVTSDRTFFGDDVTKFDAIIFNGRNMRKKDPDKVPSVRAPHQKYIYCNTESAANFPICDDSFNDFFNWTMTYKLNSDIAFPYFIIKNFYGKQVGPKIDMVWERIEPDSAINLETKNKAGAWFVSNCHSKSKREEFVKNLRESLKQYNLEIDVYGDCGKLKCPRYKESECNAMLENDYYFYMSLENSFAEDYVTEKLLTALQHNVVPIVYGGANYSRFLPPGSYIDGRAYTTQALAAQIYQFIQSPSLYKQYFNWKTYYTYHDAKSTYNPCSLCEALNDDTKMKFHSSYKDLRKWWNTEDMENCSTTWYKRLLKFFF